MSGEEHLGSRPDFDQNLENARVLLEDPPWRDNPEKYRKVAEDILLRTLRVDPRNETARRLLVKARAAVPQVKPRPAVPQAKPRAAMPQVKPRAAAPQVKPRAAVPRVKPKPLSHAGMKLPMSERALPRHGVGRSDQSFVIQTIKHPAKRKKPARSPWRLVGFMALVGAIAGIVIFVARLW